MKAGAFTPAKPRLPSWRRLLLVASLLVLPACSPPEDVAGDARKAALAAVESRDWRAAHDALVRFRAARPDTPRTLSELAGLMVLSGEALPAIWMLEEAVPRFPASDSLNVALARAALRIGRPGRAVMALEAIADGSPALAEALTLRAQGWLEVGNASETRSALESAQATLGDETHATLEGQLEMSWLGLAALEGEGDVGLADLRARVESDPQNTTAWSVLVRELRREGRSDEARTLLEAAIAALPDRIDLNALLAATHVALGNPSAAERVLRNRIKRHPTPGAHLALAQLWASLGDLDAALGRSTHAINEFPKSRMLTSERIELLLDRGLLEDARFHLSRFSATSQPGPQIEFLHARVELARDRPFHALRRLSQVVEQIHSPSTHYWLGRALEETEDPAGAESQYRIALRGNPTDIRAAVGAARLARQRGDWRAVIRAARTAVQYGPHEHAGWLHLADALAQLDEWTEAEQVARRRLARFPKEIGCHVRLSEALRAQQRLGESLAVLDDAGTIGLPKRVLRRDTPRGKRDLLAANANAVKPDASAQAPEIIAERALLLAAEGKLAEGLELVQGILAKNITQSRLREVQEARLQAVKALLYLSLGRGPEGVAASRLALTINPKDQRPLLRRAMYYTKVRRLDLARRDCESYLEERPDDPRIHLLHGMLLVSAGLQEEAAHAYRRVIELNPRDWIAANNLAWILEERGEFDEALAAASHAYSHAAENPQVIDTMGFMALRTGQAKRAVELLEKANELAPDYLEMQFHLAEAYGAVGRSGEGRRLLTSMKSRAGGNPQVLARIAEVQASLP